MKILLTGATGFVGRALVRSLEEKKAELVILTRNPERAKGLMPATANVVTWDTLEQSPSANVLDGLNGVIHLAGESLSGKRWTSRHKDKIRRSRVVITTKLIDALERQAKRPDFIISASAVGFYGDRGDECLDETSPVGEGFLAELCRQWEEAATNSHLSPRTRIAVLRLGVVLGRGGLLSELKPLVNSGVAGPIAGGQQWMSWTHIHDVVRAIHHIINCCELSGAINLVAPNPVRNVDFIKKLARTMSRPAVIPMPGRILRLIKGEIAETVTASQRVIPQKLIDHGFSFKYSYLDEALMNLR